VGCGENTPQLEFTSIDLKRLFSRHPAPKAPKTAIPASSASNQVKRHFRNPLAGIDIFSANVQID
jgi:hypothetical protein